MNGILVVNKDKNLTSRDVVNHLCKIFNTKKIGHTGTLDPIATGVLIVCIGKYTKLVDYLTSKDKEYLASFKLGIKTDTLDITGNILDEKAIIINENKIKDIINNFPKSYLQEVPNYSAVKIKGKKLYEYARTNIEVVLPKRTVNIYNLELLHIKDNIITIKTKVSKGTYIRSLIRDIGTMYGEDATMLSLERTKQGEFDIKNSYALEAIKSNNYKFIPLTEVFKNLEIRELKEAELMKIKNGVKITKDFKDYLLFTYQNEYIALYFEDKKDLNKAKPLIIF